ncbi:hypothetical protein Tsubulata_008086 [Turnera subulata]|uniref:Uncharacterized protein n=1 Tax=Turnera subulata TaxID=218843 RepID=A0A9Q0J5B2_9ROSI|nr:hypothetical protein Tsubulata_008086 [Turnera subulata]
MVTTSTSNHAPKSLKVKLQEDNKVSFSKRLTRNLSMAKEDNYHGGASIAVPFTWESQPGTPKIKFRENPLPPLTPPPSYFYSTPKTTITTTKKPSKHNLLDTIFPTRATRRRSLPVSPAFSSSSSSSSSYSSSQPSSPWSSSGSRHSMPSTPRMVISSRYGVSPGSRKSFESRSLNVDDDHHQEENDCESPVSTLCFGVGRGANARSRSSCYATISKVLLRSV